MARKGAWGPILVLCCLRRLCRHCPLSGPVRLTKPSTFSNDPFLDSTYIPSSYYRTTGWNITSASAVVGRQPDLDCRCPGSGFGMDGDNIPVRSLDYSPTAQWSAWSIESAWNVYCCWANRSVEWQSLRFSTPRAHSIGYTVLALFTLGGTASKALPAHFLDATTSTAAETIHVLGTAAGIFLWLLAFWFFGVSTVSILQGYKQMTFNLTWWGFIFPNAGFALATMQIGETLGSPGIKWLTSVMTVMLFLGWLILSLLEAKAIWKRRSIWRSVIQKQIFNFNYGVTPPVARELHSGRYWLRAQTSTFTASRSRDECTYLRMPIR